MKILVMGGTGFIGLHLMKQLEKREDEIYMAVRDKAKVPEEIRNGNIRVVAIDYDNNRDISRALEGMDTAIYLIGQMGMPGVTYDEFYRTNCLLTKRILTLAGKAKIEHFIFCSTPGVIGFGKRLGKEEEKYAPRNDYEKTKVIAEKLVIKICSKYGVKYTILRPDFVYGPGDYRRIAMYRNIMKRRFVLTTSGKSHLHPTYVEDVARGFITCIGNEKAYGEIFNIAAEYDVTSKYYLECIADVVGVKLIHINIGYPLSIIAAGIIDGLSKKIWNKEGFVSKNKIDFLSIDHSSSVEKADKVLNFRAEYDCKEGLEKTIEWCKINSLL